MPQRSETDQITLDVFLAEDFVPWLQNNLDVLDVVDILSVPSTENDGRAMNLLLPLSPTTLDIFLQGLGVQGLPGIGGYGVQVIPTIPDLFVRITWTVQLP